MEALVFNRELNKPHRIIKDIIHDQSEHELVHDDLNSDLTLSTVPISSVMTQFIDTCVFCPSKLVIEFTILM